ncbi:winged helix-turn-helix transcriptional regulator [Chitinophaga nivalis]|uniref:Helix-turn-helix transcriptional regulator n=1 Tax=Chitinophaga nivalis TaxID=2991709 RepID=A0ABT3IN90_9BACT|nr:helix-turn-helix domain-containing protein [Chitinophaga nivalis]MCW3464857.1 helix-turn-helix transcriptional regulator [Chitinophaga nivalis]MCW3485452.1 helix-turn-helix transcriptional regulator [Chitinophaga nivalis]
MIKETSSNALNKAFLYQSCRINAALEVISGRWKALILIHIAENTNRFSLLKNVLPTISDQTLGKQLKELEADKLIVREVIPEVPVRVNYHLTAKGTALLPILTDLCDWNDMP